MIYRGILAGLVATIALSVSSAIAWILHFALGISPTVTMATLGLHIFFGAVLGYTHSKLAMQEQVATAT